MGQENIFKIKKGGRFASFVSLVYKQLLVNALFMFYFPHLNSCSLIIG